MDHSKTAFPHFSHKNKAVDSFMKLPVAVTGMIAHGHGDVQYLPKQFEPHYWLYSKVVKGLGISSIVLNSAVVCWRKLISFVSGIA
jgi:hypothetical protein